MTQIALHESAQDASVQITPNLPGDVARAQRYSHQAERFKLLAHPERLRILDVLRRGAECVCHLEALLQKPQPYVSQQLRILRQAGVIVDEKRGNNVYYQLADAGVETLLAVALGPVPVEDAELSFYKSIIACGCPKCEESAGDDASARC
ncbi:MAG: metalloregulator ArsR/SmtB family transcription factor [Litorilinea sp.]